MEHGNNERRCNMIIMDGKTPQGRELKPRGKYFDPSPVTTRQMTDEEWEKYGAPNMKAAAQRKLAIESFKQSIQKRGTEPTIQSETFAKRVKEERQKRGLSTYKLADLCALTHATITNIEKGKPCRPRTVKKICEVFGWGKECFS
jgi:ribosome-binding protein aMBF1 (putative translation factor)